MRLTDNQGVRARALRAVSASAGKILGMHACALRRFSGTAEKMDRGGGRQGLPILRSPTSVHTLSAARATPELGVYACGALWWCCKAIYGAGCGLARVWAAKGLRFDSVALWGQRLGGAWALYRGKGKPATAGGLAPMGPRMKKGPPIMAGLRLKPAESRAMPAIHAD